ncbi:MAG: hypothetical protein NXY57DRAFT_646304 [Lentinula lateritia]|nr:MAG: hypothetical protein NXY57DRAFT_646304 [Lentinula lateritia]
MLYGQSRGYSCMAIKMEPSKSVVSLHEICTIYSDAYISPGEGFFLFAGFTIGISELILMLRTYSIYNKSRRVLAIFGLSWVVISAACVWAVIRFTASIPASEGTGSSSSCVLPSESNVVLVCYISLLAGEWVVTLLTIWKTFDLYHKSGFHISQVTSIHHCECSCSFQCHSRLSGTVGCSVDGNAFHSVL